MAVCTEEVEPPVIVVVEEKCCPSKIAHRRLAYSGWIRNVTEQTSTVIVEQDVIVIGESRNKDVHVAVAIIIADGDSHTRHFLSIATERHTGGNSNLLKCAVAIVPVKVIRIRIIANNQVRPAIIVEILEDGLE